jgi:glycosyltransferase involved in cell wall biosynthesis
MVLHAVASGGLYGIERTLTMLLPALRAAAWRAELLCFSAPGGAGAEVGARCAAMGVPVHYLPLARGVRLGDLRRIGGELARLKPALLHVHGYKATTLAGAVARLQGMPVMGTVHSEAASAPEVARHLRLEALILRRLTRIAAVSSGVATDVVRRGIAAARVEVVHNGITDPGTPAPRTGPIETIVIVGRLVEPKNTHVALRALAGLARQGLRPAMVVAGDGPERASLEGLVQSLELAGQVRFTGFVDDVAPLLAGNAIFVMPSRSEGIPIALLEAMAHGLPIVASRVGGIPEVVHDGRDALLVPPDDASALEAALAGLLTDQPEARALGAAARARYEADFRVDAMRDRYADLYARVLGR